jgi:acetylornithine deacetylase
MRLPKPPKLLDMICRLIATPSVSSALPQLDQGNRAVIDLLATWLEDLDFRVEIQAISNRSDKANLIATLGNGPGGLVLAGHTDTVPCDIGRWRHDPFAGTMEDNRLYGLGAADMKSFLALAVAAARTCNPEDFRQPLIILATADEESSMSGAQTLVETGRMLGRYAVIGEPTNLRPVRMHKGIFMEAIHLQGQSGHSSNPALGVNAIEGIYVIIGELLKWRTELQDRYRNALFEVPMPTLNLGHIHGGDSPNRICSSCELHIDLRPLPGMSVDELRAILQQRLRQVLTDSPLKLSFTPLFKGIEAMETPAASAIVRAAEEFTGHTAGAAAFGTEGPYLNQLGMETVILGPGSIDQAHQPDEYLALESIEPTLDLLSRLINRFCVQPQD